MRNAVSVAEELPKRRHPLELQKPQTARYSSELSGKGATLPKNSDFMSSKDARQILDRIDNYVKNSRCYVQDSLTIIDLAEATHIHPKRISYAINSLLGVNFNQYVNRFRVELAKALLKCENVNHLCVEGIGQEAGFHSKATFYKAFKENENTTPAAYRVK